MGIERTASGDATDPGGPGEGAVGPARRRRAAPIAAGLLILFAAHLVGSASVTGASVAPELVQESRNLTCSDLGGPGQGWMELKREAPALAGTYSSGPLTVTISNLRDGKLFDWTANQGIDAVYVKAGAAGSHLYRYDPPAEVRSDTDLTTPGEGSSNAISHISFCWDAEARIETRSHPSGPVFASTPVTDTASLRGPMGTPEGSVDFYLCSPEEVSEGVGCPDGRGTRIGASKVLSSGSAISDPATDAAAPGTYCWRAEYSPPADGPYPPRTHTNYSSECFTVLATPTSRLTLTPGLDANQVGDTHTFTAHLELDRGSGFVDAPPGETIGWEVVSGPGSLHAPSCVTGAGGKCTVQLTSTTVGLSSVRAAWSGAITTAAGPYPSTARSNPAEKRWVDALLLLSPGQDANQVGDTHTFVATLRFDTGDGMADAGAGETISFAKLGGVGALSASGCVTGPGGSCSVHLDSPRPGLTTVSAGWTGAVSTTHGSASASAVSAPAVKRWVDARLTLSPARDVNRVADAHTYTAHLRLDRGDGNGYVDAPAGETISFAKRGGPGSLAATSCTTDPAGTCSLDLVSQDTGLTAVTASWSGTVATAEGGAAASAEAEEALKRWVDVRLRLTPPVDQNQLGDTHTFVAMLEVDQGDGFTPAPGRTVTFALASGPGTLSQGYCVTGDGGTCSITHDSSQVGMSTVRAAWSGTITTTEGVIQASAGAEAYKHWIDRGAFMRIDPVGDANQVGAPHVFTVTVSKKDASTGYAFRAAPGVSVQAAVTHGPGSFVGGASSCVTGADGTCALTAVSSQTGLMVVAATATVLVDGVPIGLATDATSANSGPAYKRWVDARLSLTPPRDANQVGDTHTFTAALEFDHGDGRGWTPAPVGESIAFPDVSGPGGLNASSCTTSPSGTCSVDLVSTTTGLSRVRAAWSGGVATVEGTALASASSGDAVKRWVQARLAVTPHTATNVIGDTHTFTGHLEHDRGDGAGFVDAPSGERLTFSVGSGPGAFVRAATCVTGGTGRCSVDLLSTVAGLTQVRALWLGEVATAEGSAAARAGSDDAQKRWVVPSIEIVKSATPEGGPPRDVTYSYVVTNTGDVTLAPVRVTDDVLGDIGTIASLAPGASATLHRVAAVDERTPIRNVGTACGLPVVDGETVGAQVCAADDAVISVVLPAFVSRLPRTGADLRQDLLWAASLLWAGVALMVVRERWGSHEER